MEEQRAVWELYAGERLSGHVLWLGGRQLLIDADDGLRALLRSWFCAWLGERNDGEVDASVVDAFLAQWLPEQLGGSRSRRVDPETLPKRTWVGALERERLVRGMRDPTGYRSNRWTLPIDPTELLQGTEQARYHWARGRRAGFRAGGLVDDDELWLALFRHGSRCLLVVTRNHELERSPIEQANGWWRRSALHRLHAWLDGRLP